MRCNKQTTLRLAAFFVMFFLSQNCYSQVSASETDGCAPLVSVEFSHSYAGASDVLWDFDDGTSATNDDPTHTFQNPGVFNVAFSADGGISDVIVVTVLDSPEASFSIVGENQGCVPLNVEFLDESTGAPGVTLVDWSWDFGDGGVDTNTDSAPNHLYTLVGINTVTLIVEDSNGCTGTASVDNAVVASTQPTLLLESTPASISVCNPPLSVAYLATATSNSPQGNTLTYSWDLGVDGVSALVVPPTLNYNANGTYPISLEVTDDSGCSVSTNASAFIGSPDAGWELIGGPNFCDSVYFVNTSDPSNTLVNWGDGDTDSWSFGAPDTLLYVYGNPGDYTASITASSPGCESTSEVDFTVDNVDASYISSPNVTCEHELVVDFEAVSPNGIDFMWTFQESQDTLYGANVSYTYSIPFYVEDQYYLLEETPFTTNLEVITAAGCPGSYSATNDSIITPVAWFGVDNYTGCAPHSVTFSDSTLFGTSIVSWHLNFGDGITQDFTDFEEYTHVYNTAGEFEPFLVVENEFGCIDTSYAVIIEVGEVTNPDVLFSEVQVCPNDVIDFESLISGGSEVDFWSIQSDGGLLSGCINETELSSGFSSFAGLHDVIVYSNYNGCISSYTVTNAIEVLGPIGHLNVTADCENPFTITCTGGITGADSWVFDFGDGNSYSSSVDQVVDHTYATTGDYTITLSSTASTGCPDFVETYEVHVRDIEAELNITSLSPCLNEAVDLSAFGSQDVFENLNDGYLWSFGDGSGMAPYRTSDPFTTVEFTSEGVFNLRLIVDDINGCPDTTFVDITVGDIVADIDYTIISNCVPFVVDFFDDSNSNSSVATWDWSFGDGSSSGLENPSHSYNAGPGSNYTINLTVTDQNGCIDDATVNLGPDIPSANFFISDNTLCSGETANLNPANTGYDSYEWDIEDIGLDNTLNPSASYTNAGSYDVSLTVTNSSSCTNTVTNVISVQAIPNAEFITSVDGIDNLCYPILIDFTDVSDTDIFESRVWDLGTGFPVLNAAVVGTIYDQPGTYTVSLEVETTFGCTDSVEEELIIEGPIALFFVSDAEICLGEMITLGITDSSDVAYYSWDFGNGLDSANVSPLDYTYLEMPQNGSTVIQLISWSADSVCSATSELPFQVNNTIAGFDRNQEINLVDTVHCFGDEDLFTNTSIDANQYIWSFGDGSSGNDIDETHTYTDVEGGFYNITLEAYNTVTGCADTITRSLRVHPQMVISAPDQVACSYETIHLEASGGEAYQWSPGGLLNDSMVYNPLVIDDQNNVFTVLITDTNNCSESLDVIADYIYVPPLPLWTDTVITYGEVLNFQYPMEQYHNYSWTNQYGANCTGCPYSFTPTDPDFYQLVITDELGCFVDTFNFDVGVLFDLSFYVPNSFTPNNDGLNDVFYPVMNRAHAQDYEFTIWDRYGRVVWKTNDINKKWQGNHLDGTHFVQPEVYVWTIKVSDLKSLPYEFVGTVTMVR